MGNGGESGSRCEAKILFIYLHDACDSLSRRAWDVWAAPPPLSRPAWGAYPYLYLCALVHLQCAVPPLTWNLARSCGGIFLSEPSPKPGRSRMEGQSSSVGVPSSAMILSIWSSSPSPGSSGAPSSSSPMMQPTDQICAGREGRQA